MLCFVVLNVAASDSNKPNEFYGLAIGFVIVAGGYGSGAISGACFNPAVALGVAWSGPGGRSWYWALVWILFELAGAAIAACLYGAGTPVRFGWMRRASESWEESTLHPRNIACKE